MTTNPPASHKPARWRPTAAVLAATAAALSLASHPSGLPGWQITLIAAAAVLAVVLALITYRAARRRVSGATA